MQRENGSRRPIPLLLVCATYPPVLGGSEVEAQRVSAALRKRGYDVTVLCAGGPPMPDQHRWTDPYGVPVRIFGRWARGRLRDLIFAAGVVKTIWKERRHYELIYFLMQGAHLAAGLPTARLLRKPVVMKLSGSTVITLMTRSLLGRLELRWLQRWAYRIMILNSGMIQEAAVAGLREDLLHWMPNPVDTDEFAPVSAARRHELRQALGIPPEDAVAVFVGRLAPEKELPSLLEAFARTLERVPQARLILVGDGPERAALQDAAAKLGISGRVRFTGREPAGKVLQWLQLADVFTLVSSWEGLSCSLLEAMSAGLPSVVSAIPANVQLIEDGVHGLHAPPLDREALAAAFVKLLSDGPLRARMSQAARQRALETYAVDKVVDRYEELFAGALAHAEHARA